MFSQSENGFRGSNFWGVTTIRGSNVGGLIFGGSHRSGGLMSMRLGIRLIVAMIGGGV